MNQIHSVCVYSASSTKIDPVYFEAAEQLGRLLAEHHIRLVNGAGSIGLMRSVADAVLSSGGEVTGVSTTAWNEPAPYGMVLIKRGSLKMGPEEQDSLWGAPVPTKEISLR